MSGHVTINEFGDNIQASALPGDHWRKRHDSLKNLTHRMCMWAGVEAEVEVFNLFSGSVRQEGLSGIEQARQRQTLVPNLRIAVPPLIPQASQQGPGK